MLALSETHHRADQPSELGPFDGYEIWESCRKGTEKGGGGLALIYKKDLTVHCYQPEVPAEHYYVRNERQWLLVGSGSNKCAFLHVYIACQNTRDNNSFVQWNEDLFSLITQEAIWLRRQGFIVLAMGDFNSRVGNIPGLEKNTPDHNSNTSKFMRFIEEVNLMIVNTLPVAKGLFTRFNDHSPGMGSSLLDYALIDSDKHEMVSSFVIDEDARIACGSDHALLLCDLIFKQRPRVSWRFQKTFTYDIRENTDYSQYIQALEAGIITMPLAEYSEAPLDHMLKHLTDNIHKAAQNAIGFRLSKRKRGRRLPREMLLIIKQKNEAVKKRDILRKDVCDPRELEIVNSEIDLLKKELKGQKLSFCAKKRSGLRSRLLLKDPNRKNFWRFIKGQMSVAGKITALNNASGQIVFEQNEIEDVVLGHFSKIFSGQPVPVSENDDVNDASEVDDTVDRRFESDHFESEICAPYSFTEFEQMLQNLSSEKASGQDRYIS